jgi:hypothetical protein
VLSRDGLKVLLKREGLLSLGIPTVGVKEAPVSLTYTLDMNHGQGYYIIM